MNFEAVKRMPELRQILSNVHYFGACNFAGHAKSCRLFADGLVGLTYYECDGNVTFNGKSAGRLFLYGQTVKPLDIRYNAQLTLIAFFLHPYAIRYLFGIDASQVTDTCLDFDLIDRSLCDAVLHATGIEEKVSTIAGFLAAAVRSKERAPDARMAHATQQIVALSGNLSLAALRNELYISERTFERQFLQHVGVTPATFSKICRFHAAFKAMNRESPWSLTSVAYAAGYADRSHFIRQFKEFTAMTPTEYLAFVRSGNL